jgi:NADP-dependent 3-hydroxy acid dehydrogenase YdfG
VTARHVRVSVVEPGAVKTELWSHVRPEIRARGSLVDSLEPLEAEDIADAILNIVTRSRREAVNEVLIRPTEQET